MKANFGYAIDESFFFGRMLRLKIVENFEK